MTDGTSPARSVIARALAAGVIVAAFLGFWIAGPPADANNPDVCGYVRYSTSSQPTSTVPHVPHCEQPCIGAFAHVTTTTIAGVGLEVFVCVRGI